jgi:CBS domain-containing protein
MLVKDVMNTRVARILPDSTMRHAAELASLTQVSDLMVVDADDTLVGLLAEGDLIRAMMPDLDELFAAGGSHEDAYAAFVKSGQDLASQSISRLIITNPILLHPMDPVLKAATVMVTKQIRLLAVVESGRLVGTVARADVCWGLLARRR